jgi:uncharacterized lipoprotein YddW (UPF0748 family)
MRILRSFILFILFFNLVTAAPNQEFRATWVVTYQHISEGSVEQNQARVRQILDNHVKANMNAVIWQVRQSGTVYYPSSYEPWGKYSGYQDPGYDHLAYAIAEAHKRGLEFHAWINVFQASDTSPGTPAAEHPEWICRDGNGLPMTSYICLSPGLAAVREYTINVAMEIVRNYDIDGLHLDYVRWNEFDNSDLSKTLAKRAETQIPIDGMISEEQIDRLAKITQVNRYLYDVEHPYSAGIPDSLPGIPFASWPDWWRWSVTEFVRTLQDSVKAVKPWVRLSPAALGRYNWGGWNGYHIVFQDAALWFNEGFVDQIIGMHYHWTTGDGYYNMLVGADDSWQPWITEGIAEGRLYSVGVFSANLSNLGIWGRHEEIVNAVRTVDWTDGNQFFSYGNWRDYKYWEQARSKFYQAKAKIRAAKFLFDQTPPAPTIQLDKIDSLNYQIGVDPGVVLTKEQWFAIYRSEDDNLSLAEDEIVDIHFGSDSYAFIDTLSGNQDFNGRYTYFASMFDRYWNESDMSNSFMSDSVPSFPPRIIASFPDHNDTIAITSDVNLYFSKTMNTTTFENKINFTPQISIYSLDWSDDTKSVTIKTQGNFFYATAYMLTVDGTVSDILGKQLDGNGDGTAGDAFTLEFITQSEDVQSPRIEQSNPSFSGDITTDFDTDDIITIVFDELLNDTTVNDNSVTVFLDSSSTLVDTKYLIFSTAGQSVVALQPVIPFSPGKGYMVSLDKSISDTSNIPLEIPISIYFRTDDWDYTENILIDDFRGLLGDWRDPEYSGSTVGTIDHQTTFGYSSTFYLPAFSRPIQKKSGRLNYSWDPDASSFLLREYLSGLDARTVLFDNSYVLQCYIYGDGSQNKFRYALDDNVDPNDNFPPGEYHEVSRWITIDWMGWKLISWDLAQGETGSWLGDGSLDGTLRFDSFQLTHEQGNALSGAIYFKNLRLVKKEFVDPLNISAESIAIPLTYALSQNYPNPFNPATQIDFSIARGGRTTLKIYDVVGRLVATLVDARLHAGSYHVKFDASQLASGIYLYVIKSNAYRIARKMVVLK